MGGATHQVLCISRFGCKRAMVVHALSALNFHVEIEARCFEAKIKEKHKPGVLGLIPGDCRLFTFLCFCFKSLYYMLVNEWA